MYLKTNLFVKPLILITLLLIKRFDTIFIDKNFHHFLSDICFASNNFLFTKPKTESVVKNYLSKNLCHFVINNFTQLNEEYSDFIRSFDGKDVNLMVELNSEQDLQSINRNVFDSRFPMNVNIIFVTKSGTLKDIEHKIYHRFDDFRCYIVEYEKAMTEVKITYIRPVINGCHSYNGILHSNESNIKDLMTSTVCNLNGTHLKVAANIVRHLNCHFISFNLKLYVCLGPALL